MSYILENPVDEHGNVDIDLFKKQWHQYREYLASLEGKLPSSVYEFATAEWHYDYSDHRCPHDAWVETLQIQEPSSGDRRQIRGLDIYVRLLGAYHDGFLDLTYKNVHGYSLRYETGIYCGAHSDWLRDEIRLTDDGFVEHEIVFASEAHWLIACEDMIVEWLPFDEKGEDHPSG